MKYSLKAVIYLSSIAWLVYTLITLPHTTDAMINGIITAVITLANMIINDLNS